MIPILSSSIVLAFQGVFRERRRYLTTLGGFVPMLLIFVIFYVVLMLPMQKQRKALQQMIANLKKGDRVITNGGLYGDVISVDGATVILRIADNVRVKVAKSAISGLEGEGEKERKRE